MTTAMKPKPKKKIPRYADGTGTQTTPMQTAPDPAQTMGGSYSPGPGDIQVPAPPTPSGGTTQQGNGSGPNGQWTAADTAAAQAKSDAAAMATYNSQLAAYNQFQAAHPAGQKMLVNNADGTQSYVPWAPGANSPVKPVMPILSAARAASAAAVPSQAQINANLSTYLNTMANQGNALYGGGHAILGSGPGSYLGMVNQNAVNAELGLGGTQSLDPYKPHYAPLPNQVAGPGTQSYDPSQPGYVPPSLAGPQTTTAPPTLGTAVSNVPGGPSTTGTGTNPATGTSAGPAAPAPPQPSGSPDATGRLTGQNGVPAGPFTGPDPTPAFGTAPAGAFSGIANSQVADLPVGQFRMVTTGSAGPSDAATYIAHGYKVFDGNGNPITGAIPASTPVWIQNVSAPASQASSGASGAQSGVSSVSGAQGGAAGGATAGTPPAAVNLSNPATYSGVPVQAVSSLAARTFSQPITTGLLGPSKVGDYVGFTVWKPTGAGTAIQVKDPNVVIPPGTAIILRRVGNTGPAPSTPGFSHGTPGGTAAREFIAGDPQAAGVPNPELIQIENPGPNTRTHVTPMFAFGIGKTKGMGSSGGNAYNPDAGSSGTYTAPNDDALTSTPAAPAAPTPVTGGSNYTSVSAQTPSLTVPSSYLDQVQQARQGAQAPNLMGMTPSNVGFNRLDPDTQNLYYGYIQTKYGVPTAAQQFQQQQYEPGGLKKPVYGQTLADLIQGTAY